MRTKHLELNADKVDPAKRQGIARQRRNAASKPISKPWNSLVVSNESNRSNRVPTATPDDASSEVSASPISRLSSNWAKR